MTIIVEYGEDLSTEYSQKMRLKGFVSMKHLEQVLSSRQLAAEIFSLPKEGMFSGYYSHRTVCHSQVPNDRALTN